MATPKDINNQKKLNAGKKEEVKLTREQKVLLQEIRGLTATIATSRKDDKAWAKTMKEYDSSAALAAQAQAAAKKGNLNFSRQLMGIASKESEMMEAVKTGEIALADIYQWQIDSKTDLVKQQAEELKAAEEAGIKGKEMESLIAQQLSEREVLNEKFQITVDKAEELNEKLGVTDVTGKSIRDRINEANDMYSEQDGLIGAIKEKTEKYVGLVSNSQLMWAFISAHILDAAKNMRDLANDTGIGMAHAGKMQIAAKATQAKYAAWGVSADDVLEAQKEIVKQSQSIDDVTQDTLDRVVKMSNLYGLSVDQAVSLNQQLKEMNKGSQQAADAMQEFAIDMAKANDVAPAVILGMVADNTEEFARFGKEGYKNMVQAAIATKKLGIEFASIVASAEGLLDIESSIESEMNFQVMTGKHINLNAARSYALQGDYLNLTKELARQFGTIEDFQTMNVLQQQAAAQAAGLTVGEMTKLLQNQDKITNLSGKALDHYKETGELLEDNAGGLDLQTAAMWATMVPAGAHLVKLIGQGIQLGKNWFLEKAITKEKQKQTDTGKGGGTPGKGFKIKDALKAAAAMIIIAAAMWVFAQAAKEFGDEINWANVALGSATLIILGLAAALIGNMSAQVIQGALAMGILGIALIPAAFAFSLLAGVDAGAIIAMAGAIIVLSAAALVIGSIMMSGVGAVAFALGALAIAGLGLAIIPFVAALSMLKGVDVEGTMSGIVQLAMVGPLLAAAGFGMTMLGLGTLGFAAAMYLMAPVIGTALAFSDLMVQLAPSLAALAAVGTGLLMVGPALALIGIGLIPMAYGLGVLSLVKGSIPLMERLGMALTPLAAQAEALKEVAKAFVLFAAGLWLMIAPLVALAPLMPMLLLLGGIVGTLAAVGVFGGGETKEISSKSPEGENIAEPIKESKKEKEGPGNAEIIAKLDQLIAVIQQPGQINMDGRKVGEVLHMAKGLTRT